MPSTVNVQFREDPEVVRYVERLGFKAGQLAKEAFEREVRRLRAEDNARELERLGRGLPKDFAQRAVRAVREARDAR